MAQEHISNPSECKQLCYVHKRTAETVVDLHVASDIFNITENRETRMKRASGTIALERNGQLMVGM